MSEKKRILTISDAISAQTGLGRIHRDIVTRLVDNLSDVYEVATMGYGGVGTSKINVPQFPCEGMSDWILPSLPQVCEDFFGKEKITILFIWDAHRVSWFSQPARLGQESLAKYPGLREWLLKTNIEKWLYVPVDSSGPDDKLSIPIAYTLLGFDRLLAYGPYGESVIRRTIGDENADQRHLTNCPHGIDGKTFYEQPRKLSRKLFFDYTGAQTIFTMQDSKTYPTKPLEDDEILAGMVCTNQFRKDIALACETIAILSRTRKVRFWIHTDELSRYWDIPTLLADYGLLYTTVISMGLLPDSRMATGYSACDLTLAPGLGEGFGFPAAESLACQTPVITGSYAGSADFVPKEMQVSPVAYRYEGSYASKRPVYKAAEWAAKAEEWIGKRTSLDDKYFWENNWKVWEQWFREAEK
jgi:glycosyltransferase involved in cell wall biosynthesis